MRTVWQGRGLDDRRGKRGSRRLAVTATGVALAITGSVPMARAQNVVSENVTPDQTTSNSNGSVTISTIAIDQQFNAVSLLLMNNSGTTVSPSLTVGGVTGANQATNGGGYDGFFYYSGFGVQAGSHENGSGNSNGPSITLTSSASLFGNSSGTAVPSGYTWPFTQSNGQVAMPGVLNAVSYGANAWGQYGKSGYDTGGAGGAVTVTQSGGTLSAAPPPGGISNVTQNPWSPWISGIAAQSLGGNGLQDSGAGAGPGGAGGAVTVTTNAGSSISLVGPNGASTNASANSLVLNGITALSQGGENGYFTRNAVFLESQPGAGGSVSVTHNGNIVANGSYFSAGNVQQLVGQIGVSAASLGGNSAQCSKCFVNGASAGNVAVTIGSTGSIVLTQGSAIGVVAVSAASSPAGSVSNPPAVSSGAVTVTVDAGAQITTGSANSIFSIGVLAVSAGAQQQFAPFYQNALGNLSGGTVGGVTVSNAGAIQSTGEFAIGIAAASVAGGGLFTQTANDGVNYLGAGYGSAPGDVTVSHIGSIVTDGASAFGIVAFSGAAGGLVTADYDAVFSSATGSDGSIVNTLTSGLVLGNSSGNSAGAAGGGVTVNNSGSITTGDANGGGNMAIGIVAQSIGGGGGSSGGSGAAAFVGDAGGSGGNGATVTVNLNSGAITTLNDGAIGVLAQSIGGGGGNGGNAKGLYVAVGGRGGGGGGGGAVFVYQPGGQIISSGDFAAGVLAQSVGGGGGNGGYAKSVGLVYANSIGGAGGSGGSGGSVTFAQSGGGIVTNGQGSAAVLLQSVGGGGGNGGAAMSYSAGLIFSEAVSVGGAGGSGGGGGAVTVSASTPNIATFGPDSIGILAQSIGGGGGNGGGALAKALAIAVNSAEIPAISASFSLGGAGGSGGDGASVSIGNSAGSIVTANDGSNAILAQSIGGGGGNGADSSAAASTTNGKSLFTLNITTAIGGSGGSGGSGGAVSVTNGLAGSPSMILQTAGANAPGILAQSIGGGGGNGGGGNAVVNTLTTCLTNCAATTIDLAAAVGGNAGAGNIGGIVQVTNASNGLILTQGSSSPAILAQSIGGGGGAAGGGAASGAGSTVTVNVAVGGSGGSGNYAQAVTVTNQGAIVTGAYQTGGQVVANGQVTQSGLITGGDSIGILAQSIGGGGGLGGTSDAAAVIPTGIVSQVTNAANPGPPPASYNANVTVGGAGGSGSFGNTVTIGNSGSILTYGTRAYGIEAQSIGAGGGNGGEASSTNAGASGSVNLNLAGSGGGSGNGGAVAVTNSGSVETLGYGATGLIAQSIGGGGGVGGSASTSSASTIGIGINKAGANPSSGYGYQVTVSHSGSIVTQGDDAYGILAQSIGGGGGMVSAGCTNSVNAGRSGLGATGCFGNASVTGGVTVPLSAGSFAPNYSLNVSLGGAPSSNAESYGGTVTANLTGNAAIVTFGARAFGLVAQSIGGGGGIQTSASTNMVSTGLQTNPGQNASLGGSVTVNVAAGSSITTSGAGAWGVLAQSIGGGGGFTGDPSLGLPSLASLVSNTITNVCCGTVGHGGDGGAVSVTVAGDIVTTGANAHGIFAQSIGGGGGAAAGASNSPTAVLVAGNSAQIYSNLPSPTITGQGGAITINQTGGVISAVGSGSIGIVAQSSGNSSYMSQIQITVGGSVIGGSGPNAAGILVSGGEAANNGHGFTPNTVTINAGGCVTTEASCGLSAIIAAAGLQDTGIAIQANNGVTDVISNGSVVGAVILGVNAGGAGDFTNNGVWTPGNTTNAAANLVNAGQINLGGSIATVVGTVNQTTTGQMAVTINSVAPRLSGELRVQGNAQIAGSIVPTAIALLPGAIPFLSVTGGQLQYSATTPNSEVFNWATQINGNTASLVPIANFFPSGLQLTSGQSSLAAYFTRAWNNADPFFATTFGKLSQLRNGASYIAALNAYNPGAVAANGANMTRSGVNVLGTALSCPVFSGDGTLLGEDNCVWGKIEGGRANRSADSGNPGYDVSGEAFRVGALYQVAPNLFVGGALGAGADQVSGLNSSSNGKLYDGSASVKYLVGNWLFAGSVAVAGGTYDNSRVSDGAGLKSSSSALLFGGRLRAAYEFTFANSYIRPFVDLDVINTNVPSFHEYSLGMGGWPLAYAARNQTNIVVSPTVEFGIRHDFADGMIMRLYADIGGSFMSDGQWVTSASFVGASAANGRFQTYTSTVQALARLKLGAQLYRQNGWELRMEYGLDAGENYVGQLGSVRVAYHF